MPEIILPLWYRRQQVSPFAAHRERGVVRQRRQFANCVPGGAIGYDSPVAARALVAASWRVSRFREREFVAVATANDENPLAQLRHAEVGSVQLLPVNAVVGACLPVHFGESFLEKLQALILAPEHETVDVF